MIELLPRWNLHGNRPSFYDADSVTMLELAARLHGAMNELISDYNEFIDSTNAKISDFIASSEENQQVFATALRQEFQDFIDVINLKYAEQEQRFETILSDYLAQMDAKMAQLFNQYVQTMDEKLAAALAAMDAKRDEIITDIDGSIAAALAEEY